MRRIVLTVGIVMVCIAGAAPVWSQQKIDYPVPREAVRQAGSPEGTVIQGSYAESKIYPGTQRDYWLYVPAKLPADHPAPLMVFQDGKNYCNDNWGPRAHIVLTI